MINKSNHLNIEIAEDQLQFICAQAQEKALSVSEYISLCVLSHSNILQLSELTTQLRRLRYQLNALDELKASNCQELIDLQEKICSILGEVQRIVQTDQSNSYM